MKLYYMKVYDMKLYYTIIILQLLYYILLYYMQCIYDSILVADKITHYSQLTWPEWVVSYPL